MIQAYNFFLLIEKLMKKWKLIMMLIIFKLKF